MFDLSKAPKNSDKTPEPPSAQTAPVSYDPRDAEPEDSGSRD